MSHRSEKANRYAKDLDEARLNGNFHLVPNLARKLQKHDSDKQCVAKSAVCEKELNDLVAPLEKNQRDLALMKDGPNELVLPPEIRPEKMQDLVKSMEEAMNAPGTIEEKQLAEVIRSQMWMTMGQWKKVVDRTEFFIVGNSKIDNQGYSYVLILKAFAYNGIGYEGLDKFDTALDRYLRASDYIHATQPPVSYYSVQLWISKIMYRLCMLSLRLQETEDTLIHFRRYKYFVDTNFKINFGSRERLAVYYWYWRSLSEIVRRRIEQGVLEEKSSANGDARHHPALIELMEELWEMQSQYESVLNDSTTFPRAGSTNERVLEFVDRAMENWRLQGSDPVDAKGLVQVLYRATTKTSQSPRVMRHLMNALEGSGNYVEAERSLDAYLQIVENDKKTLARTQNSITKTANDQDVVQDIDSDENILRTMAAGIRILVKYQGKGKRALEIAQKMERNAKSWNVEDPNVLGVVWHAIGIANSLWSMQTIEANKRQTIQSTAISAYTTSLSYTSGTLQTYYQLALQHAWQRNLEKSISALSHALHLNKSHIPSIHLLTLVLTALEDYEKALQTCHTVKFDNVKHMEIDDIIALMEMQLTYLRIVEVVSGRDLALQIQKGVFKLYNRIFGSVNTSTGYVRSEADIDQRAAMPEPTLRRTRSNIPEHKTLNPNVSLGRESMESKLSLQVPPKQVKHSRSILKRKGRSRSADGRSLDTRSSGDVSENRPDSGSSEINEAPPHNAPESTVPMPNRGVVQRLPNHTSEVPSKYTLSPTKRRDQVAKLYRARLWLACAGIYRRGRQWEGAQAAIQDALLCDVCPEEIYTELGNLHLDRGAHFEATTNFERALLYSPDYPPATIGLAKTLLTLPNEKDSPSSRDRAEVLLDSVTKLAGWDSSEAWFWLGEIYEQCYMPVKAAECWSYCEELEERKPVREWRCVKPEWI